MHYEHTHTAGGDFLIESISKRTQAYESLHEQLVESVVKKEHDLRDIIDQAVDRIGVQPEKGERRRHLRFEKKAMTEPPPYESGTL